MIKLAFLVPVWGQDYISLMLDCLLPSLLMPKNFPVLHQSERSVLKIVTTSEGKDMADRSEIVQKCQEFLDIGVVVSDHAIYGSKYASMTRLYMLGLSSLDSKDNYVVYLTPDMFCSNGTITSLIKYLQQGKKTVMVLGPRVIKSSFLSEIQPYFHAHSNFSDLHNAKFLTDLILKTIHPLSSEFDSNWPSALFWIAEDILVAHGFHMHPFLIHHDKDSIKALAEKFSTHENPPTIDHKVYLSASTEQGFDDFVVVADPCDMVVVGLTELEDVGIEKQRSRSVPSFTNFSIFSLLYWSLSNTNDIQWYLFKHKVIFGLTDSVHSRTLIAESNILVKRIVKLKNNILLMFCFKQYGFFLRSIFFVSRAIYNPKKVFHKIQSWRF